MCLSVPLYICIYTYIYLSLRFISAYSPSNLVIIALQLNYIHHPLIDPFSLSLLPSFPLSLYPFLIIYILSLYSMLTVSLVIY